jgi:hypothetical protein
MSEQQFFQEKPETNLLVQILQRYLPFWPLFILTIGTGLAISYVYLRSQTKNCGERNYCAAFFFSYGRSS